MSQKMSKPQPPLKKILLLRALENADPLGRVISLEARGRATRDAGRVPAQEATVLEKSEYLADRAGKLLREAPQEVAQAAGHALHFPPRWARWLGWGIVAGAFALGLASNALGPERVVNILSFPLLGLALWNVCVCLIMLVAHFRKRPESGSGESAGRTGLTAPAEEKLTSRWTAGIRDGGMREIAARGMADYLHDARRVWGAVQSARAKLQFHLAAMALAGGVVAGMYIQGLAKEYRAAWESTFLGPEGLHRVLCVALGPASALTSIPVPSAEELARLQLHPAAHQPAGTHAPAGGSAAPFIHLWAATAAIFIFLPRLALCALSLRAMLRGGADAHRELTRALEPLRELEAGAVTIVRVLPVHLTLDGPAAEALRDLAMHRWGGRAKIEFLPRVEAGDEESALAAMNGGGPLLAVFSFSATPEQEVHGNFLTDLHAKFPQALVVLDAASFEERMKQLPEFAERFSQRRAAWGRLFAAQSAWLVLDGAARKSPGEALRRLVAS
jgi:hypothetical protein